MEQEASSMEQEASSMDEEQTLGLTVKASEMGELRRLLSEAWDQGYVAAGHEVRQDENPYLQAARNPNQP